MKLFTLQRKIQLAIISAILSAGILVSVVVAYPFITELYQQTVSLTRSSVDLKAANLQQIYEHQLSMARQISSRSRIAYAMGHLTAGATTIEEAQAFIAPKLAAAKAAEPEVFALLRFDPDGKHVVTIAPPGASLPSFKQFNRLFDFITITRTVSGKPLVTTRVITPIYLGEQTVGYDVVIFEPAHWYQSFNYLPAAETCFVDVSEGKRVVLDAQRQLTLLDADGCIREQGQVEVLREGDAYLVTLASGDRVVSYDRTINSSDWKLMISIPVPVMFKDLITHVVVAALLLVLLSLMFSTLGGWMIKPLTRRLLEQSSTIAQSANELKVANLAFEQSEGLLVITRADLSIYRASRSFAALLNELPRKLFKRSLLSLFDVNYCDPELFYQELMRDSAWQGEVWLRAAADRTFPCLLTVSPVRDEKAQLSYFVMTFTDISDRLAEEQALTEQVNHDALTHLFNRQAFDLHLERQVQHAKAEQRTFAVLFMDLDKFKPVNDRYGHDAGDELLREVAERLQGCLRKDDMVARRGGDEFVVCTDFLHDAARESIDIARKIHSAINKPFTLSQADVVVGISIGIALYPQHALVAEDLLKLADHAMYQVKQQQRNSIILYHDS